MDSFNQEDLSQALRAITSLIGKCEKAQGKLQPGTAQYSLLKNRIKAFYIASSLISEKLEYMKSDVKLPELD